MPIRIFENDNTLLTRMKDGPCRRQCQQQQQQCHKNAFSSQSIMMCKVFTLMQSCQSAGLCMSFSIVHMGRRGALLTLLQKTDLTAGQCCRHGTTLPVTKIWPLNVTPQTAAKLKAQDGQPLTAIFHAHKSTGTSADILLISLCTFIPNSSTKLAIPEPALRDTLPCLSFRGDIGIAACTSNPPGTNQLITTTDFQRMAAILDTPLLNLHICNLGANFRFQASHASIFNASIQKTRTVFSKRQHTVYFLSLQMLVHDSKSSIPFPECSRQHIWMKRADKILLHIYFSWNALYPSSLKDSPEWHWHRSEQKPFSLCSRELSPSKVVTSFLFNRLWHTLAAWQVPWEFWSPYWLGDIQTHLMFGPRKPNISMDGFLHKNRLWPTQEFFACSS